MKEIFDFEILAKDVNNAVREQDNFEDKYKDVNKKLQKMNTSTFFAQLWIAPFMLLMDKAMKGSFNELISPGNLRRHKCIALLFISLVVAICLIQIALLAVMEEQYYCNSQFENHTLTCSKNLFKSLSDLKKYRQCGSQIDQALQIVAEGLYQERSLTSYAFLFINCV